MTATLANDTASAVLARSVGATSVTAVSLGAVVFGSPPPSPPASPPSPPQPPPALPGSAVDTAGTTTLTAVICLTGPISFTGDTADAAATAVTAFLGLTQPVQPGAVRVALTLGCAAPASTAGGTVGRRRLQQSGAVSLSVTVTLPSNSLALGAASAALSSLASPNAAVVAAAQARLVTALQMANVGATSAQLMSYDGPAVASAARRVANALACAPLAAALLAL